LLGHDPSVLMKELEQVVRFLEDRDIEVIHSYEDL